MTISITNTRFKGRRFISVPAGSCLPDLVIRGSFIVAEDAVFEERDSHQAAPAAPGHHCKIYAFPTARR
jgi:acetoin utilization deacetylase AcuC-like enzyme